MILNAKKVAPIFYMKINICMHGKILIEIHEKSLMLIHILNKELLQKLLLYVIFCFVA